MIPGAERAAGALADTPSTLPEPAMVTLMVMVL